MKNSTKLFTTFCLSLTLTVGSTALWQNSISPAAARTPVKTTANRVYERANPAVVMIRSEVGLGGSGFIVSADGYVVTNAHVMRNKAAVVTVMMADGKTEMPADLVGFARDGVDLALLKINRRGTKLPVVQLGTAKSLQVGDNVYAIGTPMYETNYNTFTSGIVSAIRDNGGTVQHNVAINGGNSGGPLLNDRGLVVGVNTSGMISPVVDSEGNRVGSSVGNIGVNYAISADVVQQFLINAKRGHISPVATIEGN